MDKTLEYIKYGLASVVGSITVLVGGWDLMLQVLVLFVVLDYITGVIAAWSEKSLNSEIGAKGIIKKILLFVIVAVAFQLDKAFGQQVFRFLAIWFYLANEALSILENCGRAGVPLPAFLKTALEQLRKKADAGENLSNTAN